MLSKARPMWTTTATNVDHDRDQYGSMVRPMWTTTATNVDQKRDQCGPSTGDLERSDNEYLVRLVPWSGFVACGSPHGREPAEPTSAGCQRRRYAGLAHPRPLRAAGSAGPGSGRLAEGATKVDHRARREGLRDERPMSSAPRRCPAQAWMEGEKGFNRSPFGSGVASMSGQRTRSASRAESSRRRKSRNRE